MQAAFPGWAGCSPLLMARFVLLEGPWRSGFPVLRNNMECAPDVSKSEESTQLM